MTRRFTPLPKCNDRDAVDEYPKRSSDVAICHRDRPLVTGYTFGPVPSRRFGLSLGVDIVPFKTCTYDCIYCQLGSTGKTTLSRDSFVDVSAVLAELKDVLALGKKIDIITFSGSGEPTLNKDLGVLISEVKKMTKLPVAVLTNGSLLWNKDVRRALMLADIVAPSLDAGDNASFIAMNRPCSGIDLDTMVNGLVAFGREFKGKIWLEIFFARGINDSDDAAKKIADIVKKMRTDKIHLNTVARPPADMSVAAVSQERMKELLGFFGKNAEVIAEFAKDKSAKSVMQIKDEDIIDMLKRRPCTVNDISSSLGVLKSDVEDALKGLVKLRKVVESKQGEEVYYHAR